MPKRSFSWPCSRPEELAYEFGDDFVSYCLNLDSAPTDEAVLGVSQMQVLDEMYRTLIELRLLPSPMRGYSAATQLAGEIMDGRSRPIDWRIRSGGAHLEAPESDLSVEGELSRVGLRAFPYKALAESFVIESAIDAHSSLLTLQEMEHLYATIVRDEVFGEYFGPVGKDGAGGGFRLDRGKQVLFSDGNGFGIQAFTLAETLLGNAFAIMSLSVERPTEQDFYRCVRRVVQNARMLVSGETVEELRYVGLHGIQVLEPQVVHGMTLRPIREKDRLIFSNPFAGQPTAVLECKSPLRVVDSKPLGDVRFEDYLTYSAAFEGEFEASRQAFDDGIEKLRLAMVLASPDLDSVIAPSILSEAGVNPLRSSRSLSYRSIPTPFNSSVVLDGDRAKRASDWMDRLIERSSSSTTAAGRRLLSAIAERRDPIDSFVDGLIVWESLVGTGTEISFRVCASLAVLLEPVDIDARRAMVRELKSLYGKRSRIVHGSDSLTIQEATECKRRAVSVGMRAMQTVLKTPVLAGMKAEDRSNYLLVGVSPVS